MAIGLARSAPKFGGLAGAACTSNKEEDAPVQPPAIDISVAICNSHHLLRAARSVVRTSLRLPAAEATRERRPAHIRHMVRRRRPLRIGTNPVYPTRR